MAGTTLTTDTIGSQRTRLRQIRAECVTCARHGQKAGMELYQAEWCPHSHKIRQRLTELGLDFTARQVPAEKDERADMDAAVGTNEIPVLVDGGRVLKGEEEILRYLDERYEQRADADRHRAKAHEEVPEFDEAKRPAKAA